MKSLVTVLLVLLSTNCWSQKKILGLFSLEEPTILHEVDSQYVNESVIYIKDYTGVNLYLQYGVYREMRTVHKVIKVQDDYGIEHVNTLEIDLSKSSELISIKIRTISKDGKIKDFDESYLKNINGPKIKLAIPGLEIGSEVELLYSISQPLYLSQRVWYINDYPIQNQKFELFFSEFSYLVKCYNGLSAPKLTKSSLVCETKNVDPLSREGLASFRSKIPHIDFKLEGVFDEDHYTTWETISKDIISELKFLPGKKMASKFMEDLNLDGKNKLDQIFAIEEKIKTTIVLENKNEESYENVRSILKTGLANKKGLFNLYVTCFKSLGFYMNFVRASSRFDGDIDESFASYRDLDYPIIYFPDIDKYVSPLYPHLRLGFPPFEYGNSRALFVSPQKQSVNSIYQYKSHKFSYLPLLKGTMNTFQKRFKVNLSENFDSVKVHYFSKTKGYGAFRNRYWISSYLEGEDVNNGIIKGINDLKVDSFDIENLESKHSLNHKTPLIANVHFTSASLVEKLEDNILVNLGMLIGAPEKLEEEKNRTNDVIINYPQLWEYKIDFTIPEGYSCTDLETLSKYLFFNFEKGKSIYYNLSYEQVDNILKITVKKGFNTYLVDKDHYKDYLMVNNEFERFSHYTLVLEKKK